MILPIKRIPEGHSVLSQVVELNDEQAQWLRTKKIACHAEIDRIRSQVHARIFYEGNVSVDCSRCLAPIEFPIKGDFRIVCVHRGETGKDGDFTEDEIDFVYDDTTDDIDATSLVYEEVLISIPMKPLCSDDCKGFGFVNEEHDTAPEKHGVEPIDPRWDALKKLKK